MLAVSAATIDRMLGDVKIAAAGGRRRRAGFYSAIRREVPIRTFNDWKDPAPGFCEIDMVAHGGTSVAGSFIQTLTMVDVATGWTECLPLVNRDGSRCRGDQARTELVPLADARCRLRQRQCVHERGGRSLVSRTETRGDTIASLQKERSSLRRAEERRGRPTIDGIWPVRRRRDGSRDGPALRGGTALRELLPAIVQAEGEASRRRQGDQALSQSVDALRASSGTSDGHRGREEAVARAVPHARSRGAAGRDPRSAGGTRQSHRPSCRRRAPRDCRWKERCGPGRALLARGAHRIRPRARQ